MVLSVPRLKLFAIGWLLLISILFFLPGSAFPKQEVFGLPHSDKYIHFIFFLVLVFLWRFYFGTAQKFTWRLLLLAAAYGLGVELVQHYFIINRSFDTGDVVADVAGAVAGLWFWTKWYKKNRPL